MWKVQAVHRNSPISVPRHAVSMPRDGHENFAPRQRKFACEFRRSVGPFFTMAAIFDLPVRGFPDGEFLQRQRLLEKVFTTEARGRLRQPKRNCSRKGAEAQRRKRTSELGAFAPWREKKSSINSANSVVLKIPAAMSRLGKSPLTPLFQRGVRQVSHI